MSELVDLVLCQERDGVGVGPVQAPAPDDAEVRRVEAAAAELSLRYESLASRLAEATPQRRRPCHSRAARCPHRPVRQCR